MRVSTRLWKRLPAINAVFKPQLTLRRPVFSYPQSARLGSMLTGRFVSRSCFSTSARYASTEHYQPLSITDPSNPEGVPPTPEQPSYQLTFTCKPCSARSSHRITKHGYHKGTVLVTCPSCHARHIISDHLKVFVDEDSTLEDILQRKAAPGTDLSKLLKKGKLGMRQGEMVGREGEEDIEFWEDGTETEHGVAKKE